MAIRSGKVWEPRTIELLRAECGHGDIAHAGTYFGDFLPALSQALAPGAKVWACEPSLENYRCAKITIEINALHNVELRHAALGMASGHGFLKTKDAVLWALGGASRLADDGDERVEIVRLDDLVAGRTVSVIQLDVEGHEEQALRGALDTIIRCRPLIVLEAIWLAKLPEFLTDLGYRITAEVHGNVVLRKC
jgi:FkbM family methyltransferase